MEEHQDWIGACRRAHDSLRLAVALVRRQYQLTDEQSFAIPAVREHRCDLTFCGEGDGPPPLDCRNVGCPYTPEMIRRRENRVRLAAKLGHIRVVRRS